MRSFNLSARRLGFLCTALLASVLAPSAAGASSSERCEIRLLLLPRIPEVHVEEATERCRIEHGFDRPFVVLLEQPDGTVVELDADATAPLHLEDLADPDRQVRIRIEPQR